MVEAQNFFNSQLPQEINIAYFISDGENNQPDFSSSAAQLQHLAEVRAFGIGNADIDQLNIIDSDDAVFLSNPSDITAGFDTAIVDKNTIERIDVKLGGTVVDTITPDQLVEDTFGLKFEGTIDGLEVTGEAENEITFDVVFNDGTPTTSLEYKITTGQEQVTQQTDNGTKQIITFSVNQADFTGSSESVRTEIIANDLDNVIEVVSGENTIFGNSGNDRFILSGGVNLVDGGEGIDTAQINKTREEAGDISKNGNVLNIGTDNTLLNVEFIQFSDVRLAVDTLFVTPTLSLANQDISIAEGNTGSTTATFTVNLSSTTTEDVVIDFTTRSDDADAGADFVETTGKLTIAAGESSGDITVEILGDTGIEGDESVFLDLSVVSGGTFADGATTATAGVNIVNDDSAVIAIPLTQTVIEGNPGDTSSLSLTLLRDGSLSESDTIKVEIIEKGDNPAQASDFVDGFFSREVIFAAGENTKTIDISINPDEEFEGDETFGVKLTSVSGSALVPSEELIFTIFDDEFNQINGTTNDDHIQGTPNNDEIFGESGNDTIDGGQGNDTIEGDRGGDIINGGAGNDILAADRVDRFDDLDATISELRGENGNDFILGSINYDFIDGGQGNDTIFGESGDDLIFGGSGIDLLFGGIGNDTLRGQGDVDFAVYSDLTFDGVFESVAGVDVNLKENSAIHSSDNNALSWTDTLREIEGVFGTTRNDRFIGDENDNAFNGLAEVGSDESQTTFTDVDGDDYQVIADVVEYSGNQSDFTIFGSVDNFTVSSSAIGTDTLIDIEFLKFDDGLVTVDDSLFV